MTEPLFKKLLLSEMSERKKAIHLKQVALPPANLHKKPSKVYDGADLRPKNFREGAHSLDNAPSLYCGQIIPRKK